MRRVAPAPWSARRPNRRAILSFVGWSYRTASPKTRTTGVGHELLRNGPTFMTLTIFWALLAAIVAAAIAIGIGVGKFIAAGKARAEAVRKLTEPVRHIDQTCATNGHAYGAYDTGWRCATCGNHVARRDGELYGLAKDGHHERRRQAR